MRYLTEQEIRSDFVAGGETADGQGGYVPDITNLPSVNVTPAISNQPSVTCTTTTNYGQIFDGALQMGGGLGGALLATGAETGSAGLTTPLSAPLFVLGAAAYGRGVTLVMTASKTTCRQ